MGREIKFRAWHKDHNKMEYPGKELEEDSDCWDGVLGSVCLIINDYIKMPSDRVWMQFTGLTDKNGKEIYEGDIYITYGSRNEYYIVSFANGAFCGTKTDMKSPIPLGFDEKGPDVYFVQNEVEVVGNIYEDSHLIK